MQLSNIMSYSKLDWTFDELTPSATPSAVSLTVHTPSASTFWQFPLLQSNPIAHPFQVPLSRLHLSHSFRIAERLWVTYNWHVTKYWQLYILYSIPSRVGWGGGHTGGSSVNQSVLFPSLCDPAIMGQQTLQNQPFWTFIHMCRPPAGPEHPIAWTGRERGATNANSRQSWFMYNTVQYILFTYDGTRITL